MSLSHQSQHWRMEDTPTGLASSPHASRFSTKVHLPHLGKRGLKQSVRFFGLNGAQRMKLQPFPSPGSGARLLAGDIQQADARCAFRCLE